MLALVILFVVSLIVSAAAVWLYRLLFNWQGHYQIPVANSETTTKKLLKVQQNSNSLTSSFRENTKRSPNSNVRTKTPWGW